MTRTTARRAVAGTAATALGLGLIAVGATPALAASACELDCIGAVTRTIEPDKAALAFATTTSARVEVTIAPYGFAGSEQSWTSTGTAHAASTGVLAQGKNYRYQIVATDAQGATWQETGYFTTKVRTLSIDWASVAVTDDSDLTGAGEIGAAGQLEGEGSGVCQWKALSPFPATGNTFRTTDSSSSPLTISDTANVSCSGVEASMYVAISMIDNDYSAGDTCSSGPTYPWTYFGSSAFASNGSTTCWDWSSGYTKLTFPQAAGTTGTQSQAVTVVTRTGQYTYDEPTFSASATATFTIATPAASLPATSTGRVTIPLTLDGSKNMQTGQMPRILASWSTPSIPNQPLSSTTVRLRKAGGPWIEVTSKALNDTTHEFVNLDPGASYEVGVWGRDAAGNEYAGTVKSAVAQSTPAAPVSFVATPAENSVALSWQPGADNGSPILDYRVRYRKVGDPLLTVLPFEVGTTRTVTGLAAATAYEFLVEARNANEVGAAAITTATTLAAAQPPVVEPPVVEPPAPLPAGTDPLAPPAPAPAPAAAVAPTVTLSSGAKKKDGRARAVVTGYSAQVGSVTVLWCDTRVSGSACSPTKARKRGTSGALTSDGTLDLKLTSTRASTFNGVATAAGYGRIKARRADRIRFQVITTWTDGRVERSAVTKVRL